ncbi:hypothetical protein ONE63_009073 [Megalurothrips usitatus]|uniref:Erythroid differentiation-related factor 1 n=1 Tax=Megalurothrips usitatus TaxID=439358 RepID=A0AAV7XJE5_9NEOP|nr:hypothetical protein ONE63_009073 [Megalurothrips usitatus]
MEESNGIDDNGKPRDAELPLKKMRNWQLMPSAGESPVPVKSIAVVKYSAVPRAASFAELQCNTDLKLPPSNWLSSSAESYGLQHVLAHSTGFSSFRLAHMFPDCVGEVDIVSDAENIKKLLKIPYSRGAVSMMVHRVQNTLLIDDFDVHKLLLEQSRSDWEWLREFLLSNVLQSMSIKDKGLLPSHRRSALQSRHLVSKFLHHTLAATNPPPPPPPLLEPRTKLSLSEPPLPEPQDTEGLPDSKSHHKFLRNVVWNFEDLQMLLGTDMPIFGGPAHPCISLRLCDMAKPISVLTGIDYWLDNLMSNVPEVVMCFHLDGIVKRYELVKTEDLPYSLPDSKFSPKVIRDVAQNILSFLKTNAAKAGHTYWLFKGKDDDVVKLYDLTSLCSDSVDENDQNPFTVPVAMLLYRVARNMKHSAESQYKRNTIANLLENCVRLLDAEKYPQIVTSAHYMLSDLYIPMTIDPDNPVFDDELDDEEKQEGNQKLTKLSTTNSLYKKKKSSKDMKSSSKKHNPLIDGSDSDSDDLNEIDGDSFKNKPLQKNPLTSVMSLNLLNNETEPKIETDDDEASEFIQPPPLADSVPERCMLALKHVAIGLQCLQYFVQDKEEKMNGGQFKPEEEEAPQMAKPFEPIPMPYAPLNKTDKDEPKEEKQSKNKKHKAKNAKAGSNEIKSDSNSKVNPNNIKELLCPMPYGCMPTWQAPDKNDDASWKSHLKILLYEKACLVYVTYAEHVFMTKKFGRALQMFSRTLRCWETVDRLMRLSNPSASKRPSLESYLLGRAADCCFMMVQGWYEIDSHQCDLESNTSVDAEIEHEMFRDCPDLDTADLIPEKIESMEQILLSSLALYEKGLSMCPELVNFYRRIGNLHNELGCLYMNQAQAKYDDVSKRMNLSHEKMDPVLKQCFQSKFDSSLSHLEAGIRAFDAAKDLTNKALLHSNIGRLLRMCAHFHVPNSKDPKENFLHERAFYNKSLTHYQTALQYLGQRDGNEAVWDCVMWEQSTALYNMALQVMEKPSAHLLSQGPAEVERVCIEYLNRALKHCDANTPGAQQPHYQHRAATLHYKLATLLFKQYRGICMKDESRGSGEREDRHARAVLQSTRLHYSKCVELFFVLDCVYDYFVALFESIGLEENVASSTANPPARLRITNTALELFFSGLPMLKKIVAQDNVDNADSLMYEKSNEEKIFGLLKIYEQRIQANILLATKFCSQCKKEELSSLAPVFKNMYLASIRAEPGPANTEEAISFLAKHLVTTVTKIKDMWATEVKKNFI